MIGKQVTPQSEDDIIYLTSRELNIPEDQIRFVIRDFYKSLRYFISNPLISAKGILINTFFKFNMKKFRMKKHIEKLEPDSERYQFYKTLLQKIENDG